MSFDREQVRELLGPAESQYIMTTSLADCLPLSATGDTVQDNFQFRTATVPTRVSVNVDVTDATCAGPAFAACASKLAAPFGPLDPKFALYPPGVTPALGPFNGYFSAQCGAVVDTGCAPKPVNACIMCDTRPCTDPAVPGNVCAAATLDLGTPGAWTLAVAAQAPKLVPQSQGCYVVTVTAQSGLGITPLVRVGDDTAVTFLPVP